MSFPGSSFLNPDGDYGKAAAAFHANPSAPYIASPQAVALAVRREAALTSLLMLLPHREAYDAALTETQRRADVFIGRMTATSTLVDDPYTAALESVTADVMKGLL